MAPPVMQPMLKRCIDLVGWETLENTLTVDWLRFTYNNDNNA